MEKIIIGTDGAHLHSNTVDFACYLAHLTRSRLSGIFLTNPQGAEIPVMKIAFGMPYVETIVAQDIPGAQERTRLITENTRLFEEVCKNRGVNCSIRRAQGVPVEEIIAESRFADLLVANPETSFGRHKEEVPTGFIKELLAKSECPVAIAPYSFYGVDEIVFTYDGSASSVFAIKQFTYLFPAYSNKKLTVLQVTDNEETEIIEKTKLLEFLQMHYSDISFKLLTGKPTDELFGFLLERKNAFVVMGAFGRKMLSDFFKKSTAELVLKTVNLPVFIAHH